VATAGAIPLYLGLQRGFGLRGVAVASVLALGGYTAALAYVWYRRRPDGGDVASVTESAARAVPLVVPGGLAAFGVALVLEAFLGTSFAAAVLTLITGTGAFIAVALAVGATLSSR
jgi:hypothetical protein